MRTWEKNRRRSPWQTRDRQRGRPIVANIPLLLAQAATSTAMPSPGIGALAALVLFIAASVWLGTLAQKVVERSQFIQGYFQGNRGLGPWTIALTATVQSGGTFMGFPSPVYKSEERRVGKKC